MTDTEKLEKITKYIKASLAYLDAGQYSNGFSSEDYLTGQEAALADLLTYIKELE
jgi:hypothetical protein